jgi:hypothetical protein
MTEDRRDLAMVLTKAGWVQLRLGDPLQAENLL